MSVLNALRPKKAGDMRYLAFGQKRQWFYVEWGDGAMVHLGPVGVRLKLKVWLLSRGRRRA